MSSQVLRRTTVGFDTAVAVAIKYYRVWFPFIFQTQTRANIASALQFFLQHESTCKAGSRVPQRTGGHRDGHRDAGEGADAGCCHDPPQHPGQINLLLCARASPHVSRIKQRLPHLR